MVAPAAGLTVSGGEVVVIVVSFVVALPFTVALFAVVFCSPPGVREYVTFGCAGRVTPVVPEEPGLSHFTKASAAARATDNDNSWRQRMVAGKCGRGESNWPSVKDRLITSNL